MQKTVVLHTLSHKGDSSLQVPSGREGVWFIIWPLVTATSWCSTWNSHYVKHVITTLGKEVSNVFFHHCSITRTFNLLFLQLQCCQQAKNPFPVTAILPTLNIQFLRLQCYHYSSYILLIDTLLPTPKSSYNYIITNTPDFSTIVMFLRPCKCFLRLEAFLIPSESIFFLHLKCFQHSKHPLLMETVLSAS